MDRGDFQAYKVANQAKLVRTPPPPSSQARTRYSSSAEVARSGSSVTHLLYVSRLMVTPGCARMRGVVDMEGSSHARVPDYRETAPLRKASQFDVRLAHVRRISVSDGFGNEGLLALPGGRVLPEWAVNSLEGGASTPEATGAGACCEEVPKNVEHGAASPASA